LKKPTKKVIKKKETKTSKVAKKTTVKKPVKKSSAVKKKLTKAIKVKPKIKHKVSIHKEKKSAVKASLVKKEEHKVIADKQIETIHVKKKHIKKLESVQSEVAGEKTIDKISKTAGRLLEMDLPVNIKDLSVKLQEKPSVLIKSLLNKRIFINLNQYLGDGMLEVLKEEFNFDIKPTITHEDRLLDVHEKSDEKENLSPRPPVVTFMGHVDHGKTSLLDRIRESNITEKEHGGITQHIGAYEVNVTNKKKHNSISQITFLDTPGHEAFTELRARGARATDIVVLVIAADDGVMPQTVEAIDHSKLANVSIIVAVNKIDKPGADVDKIKKQLNELDLIPEDWGGKTIFVNVSAKTGEGINDLLEMILLESEMLELQANYDKLASGVVLEAKVTKDRGNAVTVLVQNGTVHLNDFILAESHYGKIRAMFDEFRCSKEEAGPSVPIEILGFTSLPHAGEKFFCSLEEKLIKELSGKRKLENKAKKLVAQKRISLEELSEQIKSGKKVKELRIIIKADVQGSLDAIAKTLSGLTHEEIRIDVLHKGVGAVNTSDVLMATVSGALIVSFNIGIDELAKEKAVKENIEVRSYNIIYELSNELKQALEGMLEPKYKKIFVGRALVKQVFITSKSGAVAGCLVQKGKIMRKTKASIVRNGNIVYETELISLKRFKDDVKEVTEGIECGISLNEKDLKAGDTIEIYQSQQIKRKL